MIRFLYFLIFLILFNILPLNSKNIGEPFQIIDNKTADIYDQQNPKIVDLSDKNMWFVVYEDWRNNTGVPDIYGAFVKPVYNSSNNIYGAETCYVFKISDENATVRSHPSSAYNPDNQTLIVAWQSNLEIKYKIFDIKNLNINSCSNISLLTSGTIGEPGYGYRELGDIPPLEGVRLGRAKPKVIYNSLTNKFWIGWIEARTQPDRIDFFSDACGELTSPVEAKFYIGNSLFLVFASLKIDTGTISPLKYISTRDNSSGIIDNSTLRRISKECTVKNKLIAEKRTYEYFSNIMDFSIYPYKNDILISWNGIKYKISCYVLSDKSRFCESGIPQDSSPQIYVSSLYRIFNGQEELYPISKNNNDNYHPDIGYDPIKQRFLIVWENNINGVPKIYGQLIDGNSLTLYQNNFPLMSDNEKSLWGSLEPKIKQTSPSISFDTINQRFVIAWQDNRNGLLSSENLDIYGQNVDTEGSLRGYNFLLTKAENEISAKGNQYSPDLSYDLGLHAFLSVWKDARNLESSRSDIYAQLFTPGQPQLFILKRENNITSPLLPLYYDFQGINIGEEKTLDIIIKNTGDYNLKIYDIYKDNSSVFYLNNLSSDLKDRNRETYVEITPGAEISFTIKFSPKKIGSYQSKIYLESDAGKKIISLQGMAIGGSANISDKIDFGSIPVGSEIKENINIQNTGTQSFSIINIELLDNSTCSDNNFIYNSSKFKVNNIDKLIGTIIEPGKNYKVDTTFYSENSIGNYCAKVKINLSFIDTPFYVELYGKAIPRSVNVTISPDILDFDTYINTNIAKKVVIKNFYNNNITISEIKLPSSSFSITNLSEGDKVLANSVKEFSVNFNPINQGTIYNYLEIKFEVPDNKSNCTGNLEWDNNTNKCFYSKKITINAIAKGIIKLSKNEIDFGETSLKETVEIWNSIINNTKSEITLNSILGPNSPFSISNDLSNGMSIAPDSTVPFKVSFVPQFASDFSSSITLKFSNGQTLKLSLKGKGVEYTSSTNYVSAYPANIDFGEISPNSEKIAIIDIRNTGSKFINLINYKPPYEPFELISKIQDNLTLSPNDNFYIKVKINGKYNSGTYNSNLSLTFSDGETLIIPISGKISTKSVYANVSISENPLNFDSVIKGKSITKTIFLVNNTSKALKIVDVIYPAYSEMFSVSRDLKNKILYPNESFPISIKAYGYYPPGEYNSYLELIYDNGQTTKINLKAKITSFLVNKKSINFGKVKAGNEMIKNFEIINYYSPTIHYYINSLNLDNDNCFEVLDIDNITSTGFLFGDKITVKVKLKKDAPLGECNANLNIVFSDGETLSMPVSAKIISKREEEISKGIKYTFPDSKEIEIQEGLSSIFFLKISNKNITSPKVNITGNYLTYELISAPSSNEDSEGFWIKNIFKNNKSLNNSDYIYAFYLPPTLRNKLVYSKFKYYPSTILLYTNKEKLFFQNFIFKIFKAPPIWKDYIPELNIIINQKHAVFSFKTGEIFKLDLIAKGNVPEKTNPQIYLLLTNSDFSKIWWIDETGNSSLINLKEVKPFFRINNNYFSFNKTLYYRLPYEIERGIYYFFLLLWDEVTETYFFDVAGIVVKDF